MSKRKAFRPMREDHSGPPGDFGGAVRQMSSEEDQALLDEEMRDHEYAAYVEKMIQEALDDPRPPVPIDEVRRHFEKRSAEARKIYGQ